MKLRNKKTGKIVIARKIGFERYSFNGYTFNSLAELNEEWEDYKPAEPKLEGDVSEIVRLWANLHGYTYVKALFIKRNGQKIFSVVSPDTDKRIEFLGAYVADDFDAGKYTLDELCGEEEK